MNNKTQKMAKSGGVWSKLILLLIIIVLSVLLWQQFTKDTSTQIQTLSREGVVSRIQQLNRLETVAYNVDTVITSEQQGSWQRLWQDQQKGLFIARGRVVAGVDLSQLSPEMVQVSDPTEQQIEEAKKQAEADGKQGGTLTLMPNVMVTVPPVEIFTVYLDDVEVYDWQAGGFFGMTNAEPEILKQAQASAKQEVLKRACADGVMLQAENNAKTAIEQLFAMTGAEVTVATQGAGACQPVD
ncbi:DUF4230 domain-containing protein [Psychrobacter sp. FDAARGOS_221]|uniref:DUF4230 domain-containing protein n=1 Tax=Psychrobacter sp. FDAARGOS_221 TaxID=1975705 RepID=UPI000BB54506|nr:DUF4230 domain-containing protein [Psychrobacter sp. FDAARGOS_221]PNK61496.1 DUF4230 domain-containing protein [Psychrobacter sp. FDAARGOS_221]